MLEHLKKIPRWSARYGMLEARRTVQGDNVIRGDGMLAWQQLGGRKVGQTDYNGGSSVPLDIFESPQEKKCFWQDTECWYLSQC